MNQCSQSQRSQTKVKSKKPDFGRVAIVTGASSGLGRELAVLFSRSGHVILSGRDKDELERTRLLCSDPGNTTTVCGNLRDSETRTQLVSFADLYGLHCLVCSAGEYLRGPLEKSDHLKIESIIGSNLTATISLVRRIYPQFVSNLDGMIIHINSAAGKAIDSMEPAYVASKHGAAAFFKALRFEARKHNVRVLDVFSGAMQTPMMEYRDDYGEDSWP